MMKRPKLEFPLIGNATVTAQRLYADLLGDSSDGFFFFFEKGPQCLKLGDSKLWFFFFLILK